MRGAFLLGCVKILESGISSDVSDAPPSKSGCRSQEMSKDEASCQKKLTASGLLDNNFRCAVCLPLSKFSL